MVLLPAESAAAQQSDWADATPTSWHQLAHAESLLSAPEPPNPVAVCIVDSGVNITPDLEGVVIERLAYDGGDPGDTYPQEGIDDGHGTYVATFLAGQVNGWGGAGLWPRAKIVSVRVFPPGGQRTRAQDYIDGLRACGQISSVRVVNLSLGAVDGTMEELAELRDQITRFRNADDINVVAASGNGGGEVEVPARFPASFAVGSVSSDGALCDFSARGSNLDILAPGCALEQANQDGTPATFAGTSFSAPLVAATLGALRAYKGLSAAQAEEHLLTTANQVGSGRVIDVEAALSPLAISSSAGADEPKQPADPPLNQHPATSDFLDYPPPRYRLRRKRRSSRVLVAVSNTPRGSSIEIRCGSDQRETHSSRFALSCRSGARIRFISDRGASRWIRLRRASRRPGWQ